MSRPVIIGEVPAFTDVPPIQVPLMRAGDLPIEARTEDMPALTWGEFKRQVEAAGVRDEDELHEIDVWCAEVSVARRPDNRRIMIN